MMFLNKIKKEGLKGILLSLISKGENIYLIKEIRDFIRPLRHFICGKDDIYRVIDEIKERKSCKGVKIIFSEDDYISTVLHIDGEKCVDISEIDSGSQKAYFKLKIEVANGWNFKSDLIDIYKILKIIREAYSNDDINIDDLIAAVQITDEKSFNTCAFVAFNEVTDLLMDA